MPTERVLIEVFTAANMAGIEQAQKGLLGLNVQTLALAAAATVLIKVGRDGIENLKRQEEAANLLTQAYATQKDTLAAHRSAIEAFLNTNARFISDQYDTEAALAQVVRAGNNETDSMRILNDALDLAAIKHEAVSEAATTLIKVLAGNSRALKELGITTEQYNAIMQSKTLTVEEKHAALLALIEQRTAKGRETIDQTTQSQNALTKAWQDFTSQTAPPLLLVWGKLNEAATTGLEILTLYVALLEKIAAYDLSLFGIGGGTLKEVPRTNDRGGGRASGGSVGAYGAYTVGESGPETLVMGSQGGMIVPNGSGGGQHIHIHVDRGAFIDGPGIDSLTNAIARRLQSVTGI